MAVGVYGITATFGTASTGTAIGALSGAAAQNAATAMLGGGPLAAGGLGVVGGSAVLAGLVAAPALIAQIGAQELQTRKFLDQVDQRISALKSEAERLEEMTRKINDLGVRIRATTQDLAEATARVAHTSVDQDAGPLARQLIDLLEKPIAAD